MRARSENEGSSCRALFPDAKLIFSEAIPSATEAVEPVVARMMCALGDCDCTDGQSNAVELALREALANAILHGNKGNRRKKVEVDCFRQSDESILVVVRDQGRGFDPTTLDDPTKPENVYRAGGRGIFLIRHFMDDVEFERGGSEIRMRKNRVPAEQQQ